MGFKFNTLLRAILAGSGAYTITPAITTTVTTGVAPFGVVVDGVQTTCTSGAINTFHDLLYFFECSDTGMGNFTNGQLAGTPRNQFVGGPVAAFTLETVGTTTIDMWVYDGTTVWGPVTQSFTVQDPDVVYAGALTTCVAAVLPVAGVDGVPAGAQCVASTNFATVMNNASYAASNKRVLFRSGESFTTGASVSKAAATVNLYVGTYGGTAQATITATAGSITVLQGFANGSNPANNPDNWRVTNLNVVATGFASVNGFNTGIITDATGDANVKNFSKGGFTFHKCTVTDGSIPFGFGPLRCVISQCNVVGVNGGVAAGGKVGVYGTGIRSAVIDCNLDSNHGGEHVIRIQGSDYSAFISNTVARPAATKHYITQRGWQVVTASNGVDAIYNNWAYNLIDGSTLTTNTSIWTQIAPQNTTSNEPIKDILWDNNHYKSNRADSTLAITARDVSVRNNTVDYPVFGGELSTSASTIINLASPNSTQTVVNSGIRIYNNSVYRAGIGGLNFIKADQLSGGRIGAVAPIVRGNLVYAPNAQKNGDSSGTAPAFQSPSFPLPVDAVTGENSTDSQIKNTDPLFVGATSNQSGFALQSGSPYKNAAADYKVHMDALGKLRTGSTFDAGAANAPDKQVDAWTLIP